MPALPRIVIAGQIPPPTGGQNVMIARLFGELCQSGDLKVDHLAFYFTKDFKKARSAGLGKLWEVFKVIGRLVRLRLGGPIDLLIYPPGGPQNIPLFRDLFLLPWVLLFSRKTALHFHAGGIAERLKNPGLLPRIVSRLYGCCQAAIVMTDFNRCDPLACGIRSIHVFPHQLKDEFDPALVDRDQDEFRILYMGHLCPDKGTPVLLEAFARLAKEHPQLVLELAGEPLPPWTFEGIKDDILRLDLTPRVRLLGVLQGEEKKRAFGRAHLFVFPSVAPYESFGLVMVEAMMWGLPVIASDWRGNKDVLGSTADYFLAGDAASLTKILAERVNYAQSNRALSTTLRRRFESDFSLDKGTRNFCQMIQQMLSV